MSIAPAPLGLALFLSALCGCALAHAREGQPEAPVLASSASLALGDDGLYWVDDVRGAVMFAPSGGGAAHRIAVGHPSLYAPVALTDDEVIWGDREGADVRVMRAPREGGAAALVAVGHGGPIGIGVGAGHVYFSREQDGFDLLEVELASGAERLIAADVPALGIAVDGTDLLVAQCATGGLRRVPLDGGPSREIGDAYCPIALVLDRGDLFFTDYAEPSRPSVGGLGIFRVPASGGIARRVTVSDGIAFAIHRGALYTARDEAIVRIAADGTTTRIAEAHAVVGVAVDDALVYWTERAEDGIDLLAAPHLGS